MTTERNISRYKQQDDFIRLQDLFRLCLARWYWFVISLVVTIGISVFYLLTTPPVYTRSASLLIKMDSKGQSLSSEVGNAFADMGLFQTNTNVNNEMQSLQSPAVMYEVVKRLHLEMNYIENDLFYDKVLYGESLPVNVTINGLPDNNAAAFTLALSGNGKVRLSEFMLAGDEVGDSVIEGALQDTLSTPVGEVVIAPTPYFSDTLFSEIKVVRSSLICAAERYSRALSVSLPDEKATVINLSVNDVCIQRAEDLLNTVIAVYNENWIKDKNRIAVSTSIFIQERLSVIEQELGHVDESISSFKSEHLLPDVQAAANMYMEQSNEINTQIISLNTQLSMARYIRNFLSNVSEENQLLPANSGIENSSIEGQISEYNTMQLQRNNLVANSSEQNPLVQDMDQSLVTMRKAILSSVDNLIVTLNKQIESLQSSEQQTTAHISANPTQGKYLLSVERQQKVKEALYLFLLQKREENELSQAFTAYNTRVITPPSGNFKPTAPIKKNILLVAIALGLLIPVVIVFIRENINTKVRGRKDLENLTLPFVGEIPLIVSEKKGGSKNKEIVIKQGNRDIVNEAFRVLRTNMEFLFDTNETSKSNVTIITSFNPGSGKSFLTMNMAAVFSLKGKRVLVIDGDLRHSSASEYLGLRANGLSDYLVKRENDLESLLKEMPDYPGLYLLPAGTTPPNPTGLLSEPRFKELVGLLRDKFDYIFIDCPPIDIVADTQIIEKLADRTLFVVCAGLLERDMLPELQYMYEEKRFKNMAVILNCTESDGSRYSYKYGHGYGHYYDNSAETNKVRGKHNWFQSS